VLLLPEGPGECFEFGALSFDLAERLQTPIFVMLDLDIGMNSHLADPFEWDDARRYDRGKVMTATDLEAGRDFARYLDVDGDGVPFRTLPGGHPNKGAYFTRGTSRDKFARYTEEGNPYVENMERLLRKWETAKSLVPAAAIRKAREAADVGVVYYGSTGPAMDEALAMLDAEGREFDAMRLRAYPFGPEVAEFLADHDRILIVEQNRDAQMRTLLLIDFPQEAAKFVSILNYSGSPITARFIARELRTREGVARRIQEAAE